MSKDRSQVYRGVSILSILLSQKLYFRSKYSKKQFYSIFELLLTPFFENCFVLTAFGKITDKSWQTILLASCPESANCEKFGDSSGLWNFIPVPSVFRLMINIENLSLHSWSKCEVLRRLSETVRKTKWMAKFVVSIDCITPFVKGISVPKLLVSENEWLWRVKTWKYCSWNGWARQKTKIAPSPLLWRVRSDELGVWITA